MRNLKYGTICDKHKEIEKLAGEIQSLVDKCLDDGQRMENGLDDKKKRISELENESLQKDIERLEQEIDEFKAYVKELESSLKMEVTP